MQRNPQTLILMKGHPGVGKSSIARCMAQALQMPLIDKDDARDAFPCIPKNSQVDLNALSYEVMWRYAERQLQCGLSLIVDCPLAREELWTRGAALAEQYYARIVLVECIASNESIWRSRLEARSAQEGDSSSRHKPQMWAELQALLTRYDGCDRWSACTDMPQHIIIDTTDGRTPLQQSQAVIKMLLEGQQ